MPQNKDPSLLRRAQALQPEALAEVYDAYSPAIYAYALRLLGDPQLAEECTAETFFRWLKALQNGGGPVNGLRPYLYRVAHNWITDVYRRKPMAELPMDDLQTPASDPPPDQLAEQRLRQEQARAALQRLTEEQRLVISLRFIEGLELEAVAQAVGKPLTAVKSLQHRALQSLRRILLEREDEDES